MKKTTRTARKVLSVFLAVLMMLTTWAVAVPGLVLAADTYYVRVYLNIYDGANSDGYGNPYTVVTDSSSEYYGKPDDYKWDYGSSWSATDNSKGYDGEVNMAGFTLFYDNDKQYETYDLSADLVTATTTLGNNFTSMDSLTLDTFDKCTNMVQKVYPFELTALPSSLFWINDENNAINGETGFAIHKITVAESSTGQEHTLWSGLSGSESYYECYYGTITPTGLITPWDDCPDAATKSFYKDYTTSAVGTWIDPYNAGEYNTYPVNNYLSGGVSASFTVGNSGSQTNIDYIDVGNTNNYYINLTNHSTQTATIVSLNNSSFVSGFNNNAYLASGETKSFLINKGSMSGDGGFYNFSFSYTLDNVYEKNGSTPASFYQAAYIGTWNSTDDSSEVGTPSASEANKGFTVFNNSDIDVMNQFAADIGIFETVSTTNNRTDNVSFEYNYWLDNSSKYLTWQQIGFRLLTKRWDDYKIHLQSDGTTGTLNLTGDIANTGSASIAMADLVTTWPAEIKEPEASPARPWAFYNSPCTPYWEGVDEHKWGTLYSANTDSIFAFCGNIFQGSTTSSNPGKIVFNNMTWVCPPAWFGGTTRYAYFSGTINVYVFDKTDLRNYVRSLGGLGANWAPMKNRFNADKWSAYESALEAAVRVLANQKTNQKAVTDAYNALYSATEALKYTANLTHQISEVTYTKRATDYDSAATDTTKKYLIMPIGTETAVPAYDTYKYATTDTVVGKQSSNLKTNYTQYDTGINPIDYRYWKIDFAGVDEAIARADQIIEKRPQTYSDIFVTNVQSAREKLAILDREADTYSPSHQSDVTDSINELDALIAHGNLPEDNYDSCVYDSADEDKDPDIVDIKKATCLEDGYEKHTCLICGKVKTITEEKAKGSHSVESWTPDGDIHKGTCTACGEEVTESHTFVNPVLARPTQNTDGTWTDGTYTYTCICGATKVEDAVRADYSELEDAVEALNELKENENLSDEAKAVITNALADAGNLADNLVTAEQGDIDALVKELKDIKADADEAIKNKELGINNITEATSGVKVQFIDASGLGTIESVQLGKDDAFKIRVANGNADSNITITNIQGAGIDTTGATLAPGESATYDVTAPTEAGIKEYTITYTIDGLKNADGTAVTATTKAYLYVKDEAYTPYHLMDETCNNGPATAKWEYSLEASVGDFEPVYNNKAPKAEFGNENLVVDKDWARPVYHKYDYEDSKCYAECTGTGDTPYVKGDAHAATYRYYIDTSLAPTWQDAGFKAVIAEGVESKYDYAVFKYIRLANNQDYLDSIQGDNKTFSVTVIPGASSNVPTKTWTATSTGDEALTVFDTSDDTDFFKETEYLFGNYLDEAQTIYTAYTNFSGSIPQKTESANMMFSYRIGYNMAEDHFLGGVQAESTTMTTHLRITSYDKGELREAVANAETAGYNSAYFDADKWTAYENALKTAKEVLGKAETNQTEVDKATEALNNAIADLTASESEAKFVLTVTHSIYDGVDKNGEATKVYDYYLANGDVIPDYTDLTGKKINKYDDKATINVTEDKTHTYNYWYIDYSKVQDAINAADAIINDTENGYSEEYKQQAQTAKDALEAIKNGESTTTAPESQSTVNDAIDAVTALTGHTCNEAVEIPAVAPTCKEAGLKAGARCSVCGKITKAQEIDPKLPHTEEIIPAVPATCTATGLTEGKKCSACGEILVAQEVTPMADHTPGEAVVENNKSATCTAEGSYDNVTYCTKCGTQTSRETIIVDKADHSYGDGVVTAPTCTAGGYTTYTCTACGHSYTDNETSAINHSWSVSYEWADDYSTCTATRTCANDAAHNADVYATVSYEVTADPTCEDAGEGTYTADFTGDWAVDQTKTVVIASTGHNYDIANAELIARPKLVDGEWTTGKYEATCSNDESHKLPLEGVQRADYTAFDEAVAELKELANYDGFTDTVKNAILAYAEKLENGEIIRLDLVSDYTYEGATIKGEQDLINAAVTELTKDGGVIDQIEGNKDKPEYTKPDYEAWELAEGTYVALNKTNVKSEVIAEADALKAEIAEKQADKTLTQATATQDDIDAATERLNEIIVGINDGSLKDPDYSAVEEKLTEANNATGLNKETQDKIDAIEEALKEIQDRTEPKANYRDNQSEVNALEDQLDEILGDIADNSAKAPDFTEWDTAEDTYDAFTEEDLTNVKTDILDEVTQLKSTIADIEENDGANVAEHQQTIDDSAARLNEIITGIIDKSLVDVDTTEADEAIGNAESHGYLLSEEEVKELEELRKQLNEITNDPDANARDDQATVDSIRDQANVIYNKYADCADGDHNWTEWTLTLKPTETVAGKYERTCNVCGTTTFRYVAREDYTDYNSAVSRAEAMLENSKYTPEAIVLIQAALAEAKTLDQQLPKDLYDYDGTTKLLDNNNDEVIKAATDKLNAALDGIANDTTGAYEKVDFTGYNSAVDAYKALEDKMSAEDKKAVADAIKTVTDANITENTSKADGQDILNDAAAAIVEINSKYADCVNGNHKWSTPVLTTAPTADTQGEYTETCGTCGATQITNVDLADYDAFDEAVKALQDLANTENLTTEAAKAIADALAKAEALDKNLPADATTVDGKFIEGGQDEIDALVAQLQQVVTNTNTAIGDGSALLPDYDAWNEAEGRYDALDKTNVKDEIITEANKLKEDIAKLQNTDDLTQATATQDDIDNATARLNEIIAGIVDGSLRDPDYSAVEDKIDEAKGNDNLNKDTQDKIKEIEEALEAIKTKTEPEANAKDDQDDVDDLKDQLDEILDSIAAGTATAPDYTEWDEAEGAYDALDKTNVPAELVTEATNLKATIDALKADDTANVVDDQQTIDEATTELNEIIAEINGILTEKPNFKDYDASHDAYEKLVEQYGDKIKDSVANDVADLDATVDGVRNDETATKVEDQTTIDNAKTQLDAIIAGINDGSLRDPDYSAVEEKLTEANNATGLNKETQDKIDAIEKELQEIKDKEEPEANYKDDQDDVNALEERLDEILGDIADNTAKAPDYTNWYIAEGTYDDLDKTNVKEEIIAEANGLKNTINTLKADETANYAEDQKTIDDATARLNEIIAGINDGSLKNPADFTEVDKDLADAKDKAENNNVVDSVKEDIKEIEEALNDLRDTATADNQDTIDELEDQLEEIIAGINDGSLIKDADFTEVDKDLADAKDKVENNNVVDGVKEDIKEIEDKINDLKNDPATNGNDQDEIDALEKELEEIIAGIEDGSLIKPATPADFTDWDAAEKEYNELDKTRVKESIRVEVGELKISINTLKNDPATNAEDDQDSINAKTARLNEIIAGINDGSLKHPDYSGVDEKLEDLKDEKNLTDATDAKIDEIEKAIENLKKDETTNAKDNQDDVDALEKELDDIIAGIADGSLVKPDYTEADKAIKDAEKAIADIEEKLGDTLNADEKAALEELKKELEELKKSLDELKNDPASNKKDDQAAVDSIRDGAKEIINSTKVITDKYAECLKGNHVKGALIKVVNPTCTEKGYSVYICEVCGKEIKADYIDATGHTDTDEDGTCDICGATGLYDGCACLCHNNHWFWRIVYMIIRIIWKIFGMHQVCPCGRLHY